MMIADPWLLDLAVQHDYTRPIAAVLLRCQIRTFRNTGHIISFGGLVERLSIVRMARIGRVWHGPIICIRCGITARLSEWVEADGIEIPLFLDRPYDWAQGRIDMLREQCDGDRQAVGLAAILAGSLPRAGGVGDE